MYKLKKMGSYLRVNLLGPGPRLIKKNLPGRGLTKFEKHCSKQSAITYSVLPYIQCVVYCRRPFFLYEKPLFLAYLTAVLEL